MYRDQEQRNFARSLRNQPTVAEKRLWHFLRAEKLRGHKFRRQVALGPYVVDFVCLERRLVVEVDGGQHTQDDHIAYDARRDRWLRAEGYCVMRVSTTDVYGNLDGVLDTIWAALQELPSARVNAHPHQERHRT